MRYIGNVRLTLLKLDVVGVSDVPLSYKAGMARLRQMPVLQHFKELASPAMVIHLLASKTVPLLIRDTGACMWAAGLRVCEVTNPDLREDPLPEEFVMRRGDVSMALDGGSFSLLLRHSKGDAVNCGYVAHIMANRDGQGGLAPPSSCPVTMLQRLLASAGRRDDPTAPLFASPYGDMVARQHVADAVKATVVAAARLRIIEAALTLRQEEVW
jgi:hypothetical protein